MSNERQLARLIHQSELDMEEILRLIREAGRVKRKEVRCTLVHKMTGRNLQIEPLDYPPK